MVHRIKLFLASLALVLLATAPLATVSAAPGSGSGTTPPATTGSGGGSGGGSGSGSGGSGSSGGGGGTDMLGNAVCGGSNLSITGAGGDCSSVTSGKKVDSILQLVVNIITMIIGFVSVLMIIIGGLKYVASNGDSNATSSAKNTIIFAIVGLVVAALAQIIVHFVLHKLSDAENSNGASGMIEPLYRGLAVVSAGYLAHAIHGNNRWSG